MAADNLWDKSQTYVASLKLLPLLCKERQKVIKPKVGEQGRVRSVDRCLPGLPALSGTPTSFFFNW